jgi:hypothetical protein
MSTGQSKAPQNLEVNIKWQKNSTPQMVLIYLLVEIKHNHHINNFIDIYTYLQIESLLTALFMFRKDKNENKTTESQSKLLRTHLRLY